MANQRSGAQTQILLRGWSNPIADPSTTKLVERYWAVKIDGMFPGFLMSENSFVVMFADEVEAIREADSYNRAAAGTVTKEFRATPVRVTVREE